jgi:hypothetical protein
MTLAFEFVPENFWPTLRKFFFARDMPPNLTLNMPDAIPTKWKVALFMWIGLLIQAAVMVVNALTVYRWQWLRAGKIVAPYGYPVWAVGTVFIGIGTCICGHVVERSCWKVTVKPRIDLLGGRGCSKRSARIIFLQGAIPERNLPPFAIEPDLPGEYIKLSWPLLPRIREIDQSDFDVEALMTQREIQTALGAGLALSGFVCQNIGTRELHWSAGLLQLGVTLVLTLLRAWLRRRVGGSFKNDAVTEFKACDLATRLTGSCCYIPYLFSSVRWAEYYGEDRLSEEASGIIAPLRQVRDIILQEDKPRQLPSSEVLNRNTSKRISEVLQAQAWLADHDPTTDEDNNAATGCYMAMKEIVELICGGDGSKKLRELEHCTYVTFTPKQSHGTATVESVRFPVEPREAEPRVADCIRFLQAIISLTRCGWKLDAETAIFRIVGTCSLHDVKAYSKLLRAWIQPHTTVYVRELEAGSKTGPLFATPYRIAVFGLSLNRAFHRSQAAQQKPERTSPEGSPEPDGPVHKDGS